MTPTLVSWRYGVSVPWGKLHVLRPVWDLAMCGFRPRNGWFNISRKHSAVHRCARCHERAGLVAR